MNFLKQHQQAVGRRPASASMAFRLHHCHKSCRWLVAYTDREYIYYVDRTGDTVTVKQSQRRVTSPTFKIFRQQLNVA